MGFWERMEAIGAENDVLRHPFYVRWTAGDLQPEELARYAGEYRHVVVGLAAGARRAAECAPPALHGELSAHAVEEAEHVELWDRFARAVGADLERQPLPGTQACAVEWSGAGEHGLAELLSGLYAIEAAQPAISSAKLAGLRDHYGLDTPDATAYFELHERLDVDHAAADRELLELLLADACEERLLARAEAVLRANWLLLDGIQRG
jgi:pyrroloquinoline-quinone synthase